MPLEIPPPEVANEHPDMKYTWKATAEQKSDGASTVFKYEIVFEDGAKTFRTVEVKPSGEKVVLDERNEAGPKPDPNDPERKPIDPPRDLPAESTYDARRVVFTDEDNKTTTTIKYRIYTINGKYPQSEVHHPSGEVTVTKGDMEPLTEQERNDIFGANAGPSKTPLGASAQLNAKSPPKVDIAQPKTSYQPPEQEPDYYMASRASYNPPKVTNPPPDSRRRPSARGSVADRYLKNLK